MAPPASEVACRVSGEVERRTVGAAGHQVRPGPGGGSTMKLCSTVLSTLGASGLLFVGFAGTPAPASASTGSAATSLAAAATCEVRVSSVRAVEVQEDVADEDEILLRLGNTSTPQHTYFEGQLRNTLGDPGEIFSGSLRARLVERDRGSATVIDSATLECRTQTRSVTFDDAQRRHRVRGVVRRRRALSDGPGTGLHRGARVHGSHAGVPGGRPARAAVPDGTWLPGQRRRTGSRRPRCELTSRWCRPRPSRSCRQDASARRRSAPAGGRAAPRRRAAPPR